MAKGGFIQLEALLVLKVITLSQHLLILLVIRVLQYGNYVAVQTVHGVIY